jgi:hypothetical protein
MLSRWARVEGGGRTPDMFSTTATVGMPTWGVRKRG